MPTMGRGCRRHVQKNKVESFSEKKRLREPPSAEGRKTTHKATRQGSSSFLVFRRRDSQALYPQLSLFRHCQSQVRLKFSCSVLPLDNKRHRGNSADAGRSSAESSGRRTANRAMEQAISRSRRQPFRKLFPLAPWHRHHVILFKRRQYLPPRGSLRHRSTAQSTRTLLAASPACQSN